MAMHLVTGGAGFIGSHLVESLVSQGHHVKVLDNFDTGTRANLTGIDVEVLDGDIRDPDACAQATAGCDTVFHLAAIASVPRSVADPSMSFSVNATGTSNVFEAARHAGVRQIVGASSAAVYGPCTLAQIPESAPLLPQSPYGAEKATMEQLASAYNSCFDIDVTCMRFFNVYGSRQDPNSSYSGVIAAFLATILRGNTPTVHGDGSQSRDFVHVSDVVAACQRCANPEVPNGVYNVGTGRPTSVLELLRTIQSALSAPEGFNQTPRRTGDVDTSCADISRLTEVGYHPQMSLADGLKRTAMWYRDAATKP